MKEVDWRWQKLGYVVFKCRTWVKAESLVSALTSSVAAWASLKKAQTFWLGRQQRNTRYTIFLWFSSKIFSLAQKKILRKNQLHLGFELTTFRMRGDSSNPWATADIFITLLDSRGLDVVRFFIKNFWIISKK